MRNKKYKIVEKTMGLALIVLLSISLLLPSSAYGEAAYPYSLDLDYFVQIMDLVKNNYVYDVEEEQLLEGATKGLFMNLDENSQYYTPEEFKKLQEDLAGEFVGIGIYIKEENGSIIITEPIKGSPAYKAGIKPGDRLISINGKDIKGKPIEEVMNLIKGESGTTVKIGVLRGKEKIYKDIKRAQITINPVEYKILDKNIGYIEISRFSPYTYEKIVSVLKEFDKKNISGIILDLRDNPGGLLDQAVNISNLFVPEGPIVHIKYRKGISQTYYSTLKKTKYKLVVLVNENSASAAEILAGAIQDSKVGTIIGVPTYGKGTVQQILPLPLGDGMKLTIAEYKTPKGKAINNKGIQPDIIVKNNNSTKDIQLERAIKLFNSET